MLCFQVPAEGAAQLTSHFYRALLVVDLFCSYETMRFFNSICTSPTIFVDTWKKMQSVRGAWRLPPMTQNLFNHLLLPIPPASRRASHLDLSRRPRHT